MNDPHTLADLLAIMARLRDPETGCPWDIEQDFKSIAPYTIEEAYEVADAISRNDMPALKDELGDLLLQVVYHARMAEEGGLFDFADVADAISAKMIRRHPHVFGDAEIKDSDAQTVNWEAIKASERAEKKNDDTPPSVLDDVPVALPAMKRAEKLQKRAARVGFDWPAVAPVFDKIREEMAELEVELAAGSSDERIEDELGDLLFAVVNLARKIKVEPGSALRQTNLKFEQRFRFIERMLAEDDRTPQEASLDEMEALWQRAKTEAKTEAT
ncbi:MAG: nucleoside triphosphate pyrophosphohydrolase [Rhodospirillaceae bacterium]|jgi:nucleoside triphosphate diphosphatase|nr:nucleoside triphosphate pyrophosphohydrolase [Rhodospirillaceae bacterium]MBT5239861.1 nucleoside triphosphate pyrophosphohydrolase [Rhodospirillaceae bacterium]MBT5567122.1 nucleoside triphosphate pyrophosphohydrolase [Rhodospirillaceae bacterium]MBT6089336.1 nucleoside triphosphate pyrophosphohydrolase [Rhodospirillaceae bacterium]MBT7451735.1 nucleoside triphosphate pyrophosphohydrolase [Rhodospirillaceae bacterium]